MLRIVKENAEMLVSEEDFRLVYEPTGWKNAGTAENPAEADDGTRRIVVDPNTETVAGPTPIVLAPVSEGETILEDMDENRTKLGREEDADKPKVNGKPNLDRNKK